MYSERPLVQRLPLYMLCHQRVLCILTSQTREKPDLKRVQHIPSRLNLGLIGFPSIRHATSDDRKFLEIRPSSTENKVINRLQETALAQVSVHQRTHLFTLPKCEGQCLLSFSVFSSQSIVLLKRNSTHCFPRTHFQPNCPQGLKTSSRCCRTSYVWTRTTLVVVV